MKNKIPFAVIAGAFAAAAVVAPSTGLAAQSEEVKAGLYFTSTAGGQGEFYSFEKWANLSADEQTNLLLNFNHENIQIYVDVTNKIATLDSVTANGNFDDAATDFTDGNIVGSFKVDGTDDVITVGKPVDTVESVSAINATLKQAADQQLKIQINGSKEVTVEELTEAGYTVKFLFNKDITGLSAVAQKAARENGVIDTTGAPFNTEFKYAVQVTDAEGNVIPETVSADAYATVTVLNAASVTSVTGVELSNELTYVTLNETASIELVSALNAFGEEVEGATLTNLGATIKSSDVTIAYVEGTTLTARKAGTVTLTVEFPKESKIAPVTLTVEVKAAQKATSIEAKDLKVETVEGLAYAVNSTSFKVLDQYGETFRSAEPAIVVEVTDAEGEVVTSFAEEGTYTVTVYLAKTEENEDGEEVTVKGTKLGSYSVQTVDVEEGDIDTFEFSTDEDFLLDLNAEAYLDAEGEANDKHTTVALKGFIDGVELTSLEDRLAGYKLVSSDKEVFTVSATPADEISVTAKAVGTAELSLVKVEGDIETVVVSIELTVENTTPQITTLTLKDNKKSIEVASAVELTADKIAEVVTAGKDAEGNEIFTADMIAEDGIEYSAANGQVIVEIDALYGGKEFVFDVVISAVDPAPEATLESIAITSGPTKTTYTVGEDLDLAGLVVTGTYDDASDAVIEITEDMVTGFDSSAAASDQVVTVTVDGLTATFTVTIENAAPTPITYTIGAGATADELVLTFSEAVAEDLDVISVAGTVSETASVAVSETGTKLTVTVENAGAEVNETVIFSLEIDGTSVEVTLTWDGNDWTLVTDPENFFEDATL